MSLEEKQFEITWKWFQFHADQRMRNFYYYLVIIGALSWGFLQCLQGNHCQINVMAPFLSILAVIVSVAYFYLEIRSVELVNIGRKALVLNRFRPMLVDNPDLVEDGEKEEYLKEKKMALKNAMGAPHFIVEALVKHELWLRLLYLLFGVLSFFSFFYSISCVYPKYVNGIFFWIPLCLFSFLCLYLLVAPSKRDTILDNNDWKK